MNQSSASNKNAQPANKGAQPANAQAAPKAANAKPTPAPTAAQRSTKDAQRAAYRRRKQQRETFVFTVLGSIMVLVALLGIVIGFGIVPFPFFNGFSEKTKIATVGSVPCPLAPGDYLAPKKSELKVLNGTDRNGLAGDVKKELEALGFVVTNTDNAPSGESTAPVLIVSGPAGVNAAYTVAEAFPESIIELDSRPDPTVTITLGEGYEHVLSKEQFDRATKDRKPKPRPGCLPVSLGDD